MDTEENHLENSELTFLPKKFKKSIEELKAKPTVKDVYPQIIASCIAHSLSLQVGLNLAFSAVLLPQLMAPDSTFKVDKSQASWIASLVAIVTPVGSLMSGPFMDVLGRKPVSFLGTLPFILSWALVVVNPNSVWLLYLARVLAGFGGGMSTVALVYISEISDVTWRPTLLCLCSVYVSLGILLTNVLGVYLSWRVVAGLFCGLSILSAIAIAIYNPESPHWLLTFHRDSDKHVEKAEVSVHFLYRNEQMFLNEWNRLMAVKSERKQEGITSRRFLIQIKNVAHEFCKRSSLLPFLLLLSIFLCQQLSGTYPIIFYAVQVFQSIGGDFGTGLNADSATVILGVIRFFISLLTAVLSRTYGRRCFMIFSGVGMTISALTTAIYFQEFGFFKSVFNKDETSHLVFFKTNFSSPLLDVVDISDDSSSLFGHLCILMFVSFGSVGVLTIPWALIGEILPVTIRGIGGGWAFSFAYILMFVAVKVFPFTLDLIGISGSFYFFSFIAFINVIIVYMFLPETKGKRFDEIEKHFSASNHK